MEPITFQELLKNFDRAELGGYKDNTRKFKKSILNQFGKIIDLKIDFTKKDVINYLTTDKFQNHSRKYQVRIKTLLRQFLKWLGKEASFLGEEKREWELVNDFEKLELRGYTDWTKIGYKGILHRFGKFIGFTKDFTEEDVLRYIAALEEQNYSDKYKISIKSILLRFLKWLGKDTSYLVPYEWDLLEGFDVAVLGIYTNRTRSDYKNKLYQFGKYLSFRTDFTEEDVLQYLSYLKCCHRTKVKIKSIIKLFLKWLERDVAFLNGKKRKSSSDWKLLTEFIYEALESYSLATRQAHYYMLNQFGKFVNYNDDFSKSDVLNYLNSAKVQNLAINSQNAYKRYLKNFLKWLNRDYGYITFEKMSNSTTIELPTWNRINRVIVQLSRPMDKVVFMLFLESACRKGELTNLDIGDITFQDKYATMYIKRSKTNHRSIPLVESVPYLLDYLDHHPLKDDPHAPLFVILWGGKYVRMTSYALYEIIKRSTKSLAKNIYPHLLRHMRLNQLSQLLMPPVVAKLAGWKQYSGMGRIYYHTTGQDVEHIILGLYRLEKPSSIHILGTKECIECQHINLGMETSCQKCGLTLDREYTEVATNLDELEEKA